MSLHSSIGRVRYANTLLRQLIEAYDLECRPGSETCPVCDTAWVSMVAKRVDGQIHWLFPPSFQHLLDYQQHDGGWQYQCSNTAGILHSLAALLSICQHIAQPSEINEEMEDLEHRKSRAIYFLETKFVVQDLDSDGGAPHFRQLASHLLLLLQNEGIEFSFRGKDRFVQAGDNIAALVTGGCRTRWCESIYGAKKDKIAETIDYRVDEENVASPAAAAAYLISSSHWDDEAEAYLKRIFTHDRGLGLGERVAQSPTSLVEIATIMTVLLENGFVTQDLDASVLPKVRSIMQRFLQGGEHTTNFRSLKTIDAVNVAKMISALSAIGQSISVDGPMGRFASLKSNDQHGDSVFSSSAARCYILKAQLDLLPGNADQMPNIRDTIQSLCDYWWTQDGTADDRSPRDVADDSSVDKSEASQPAIHIMINAFTQVLRLGKEGYAFCSDGDQLKDRVVISIFQALIRILQTQSINGSWENGSCEVTAHAVISLSKLFPLSATPKLKAQVVRAMKHGRRFLLENAWALFESERGLKVKSDLGNIALRQAYILAALQAPISKQESTLSVDDYFGIPLAKVTIQTKYYLRQHPSANMPEWLIQANLVEAYLFTLQLRTTKHAIFPNEELPDDRYFGIIPSAWVFANRSHNRQIGAGYLYEMMKLSILVRQLEDYMKQVVAMTFVGCLFEVEDIIHSIFLELNDESKDQCSDHEYTSDSFRSTTATDLSDVRSIMHRFVSQIIKNPDVLKASVSDQDHLRSELISFLLTCVAGLSADLREESPIDQTSHSFAFAFFACLRGSQSACRDKFPKHDFLDTPEQRYLASYFCRHISIMSFMSANAEAQKETRYQPLSSLQGRPIPENTDNEQPYSRSVSSASTSSSNYENPNFPVSPISSVSSTPSNAASTTLCSESAASEPDRSLDRTASESLQLTRLLDHERRCLGLCLESLLDAGINQQTYRALEFFIDGMDLSEELLRDPNIGTMCRDTSITPKSQETCVLSRPPVPPKERKGSVAAARAALNNHPGVTTSDARQAKNQNLHPVQNNYASLPSSVQQVTTPLPIYKNFSHPNPSSPPKPLTTNAPSPPTRIESIMSEIDNIDLSITSTSALAPNSFTHRRTASESHVVWAHPHITNTTPRSFTDIQVPTPADPEALKLAKVRLETQRKIQREGQKRAMATAQTGKRWPVGDGGGSKLNGMRDDVGMLGAVRRVTSPSVVGGLGFEGVGREGGVLQRVRKMGGGPRWKAPF